MDMSDLAINKLLYFKPFMMDEKVDEPGLLSAPQGIKMDAPCRLMDRGNGNISIHDLPIHNAVMPNGQRTPLLKTMLTSVCENNCRYCAFSSRRDFKRETFIPDEMAKTFMAVYQKGIVEGLFLSSGMAGGGKRTQDRLLAAAEILRKKYKFMGYLHLKIMPGSDKGQVFQAMRLADRVSINLESPNQLRLNQLAPDKNFLDELLGPLRWVEEIRRNESSSKGWKGKWPSSTTQFVVGGVDESDLELMTTSMYLMKSLKLGRVYYSKFRPVENTPLENREPLNPWREHRLYQASFLIRDYGFDTEELPFLEGGNLPLEIDPKLAWARNNLLENPIEINSADYQTLIRIPGIGPKTAKRILDTRKREPLKSLDNLRNLGIPGQKAAPFILMMGNYQPRQLSLWNG